jgi:membrane-associated PAP2 superfamily phosphatase
VSKQDQADLFYSEASIYRRFSDAGLKHDLLVHQLCDEIALEHLEESDITTYLSTVFAGAALPPGLANLIYRHSGGNALFMATIVQDMVKRELAKLFLIEDAFCTVSYRTPVVIHRK